jgi:hypothetical protein
MVEATTPRVQPEPKPHGVAGWLLLPALGTLLTPLWLAKGVYDGALPLFTVTIENAALRGFITVELVLNLGLCLGWFYALYLLARYRAQYPPLFIVLALGILIFGIADTAVAHFGFGVPFEPNDLAAMVRALIFAAIWVPYMLRSRRVRNTFVK